MISRWLLPAQSRSSAGRRSSRDRARLPVAETLEVRRLLAGIVAEYTISETLPSPVSGIASGPDGNLWFTHIPGRIGRLTPAGVVTEFPLPSPSNPNQITPGPDGNLWFTGANGVGRITTDGVITEFFAPSPSPSSGITSGPDGNLWFTGPAGIGRITTDGVFTEFPIPTADALPSGIASGPDGNLWFAELRGNKIGRITPDGAITEFPVPTANSFPAAITSGPDGNLWFTEAASGKIGRITTDGVVSEFFAGSGLAGITSGPDGNLWFTEQNGGNISRITTDGRVTRFPIATFNSYPTSITAGPGGDLWFTEYSASKIGRLSPRSIATQIQVTSVPDPFLPGQPVTVTATVIPAVAGILPAGTVTFSGLGGTTTTVPLVIVDGKAQATLTVDSLPAGRSGSFIIYNGNPSLDLEPTTGLIVLDSIPVIPPTVVEIRRTGFHAEPTRIILGFSTPLDPARAQDVRNYRIVGPGGRVVAIDSAEYNPANNAVILRPRARLDLHHLYRLTVVGTGPAGVADPSGNLLDGAGNGLPGSDYVTKLGASQLVIGARVPGGPARLASLRKELARIEARQAKHLATARTLPDAQAPSGTRQGVARDVPKARGDRS